MTDEDRLNALVDEGPWHMLLGLADEAESQGLQERANGYRWLAREEKWPERTRPGCWRWWAMGNRSSSPSDFLWEGFGDEDGIEKPFPSCSRLLRWTADRIGTWLKEHPE